MIVLFVAVVFYGCEKDDFTTTVNKHEDKDTFHAPQSNIESEERIKFLHPQTPDIESITGDTLLYQALVTAGDTVAIRISVYGS